MKNYSIYFIALLTIIFACILTAYHSRTTQASYHSCTRPK